MMEISYNHKYGKPSNRKLAENIEMYLSSIPIERRTKLEEQKEELIKSALMKLVDAPKELYPKNVHTIRKEMELGQQGVDLIRAYRKEARMWVNEYTTRTNKFFQENNIQDLEIKKAYLEQAKKMGIDKAYEMMKYAAPKLYEARQEIYREKKEQAREKKEQAKWELVKNKKLEDIVVNNLLQQDQELRIGS